MQKDVIYLDVEDDITAIIGKVKAAEHKIIALVPPKRADVLQSAVNLKLVHRAAGSVDKRLVIISNNHALMALAGSAGIPVAKNLQSKPELAEIPVLEVDDGDDIIDGKELPEAAPTATRADESEAAAIDEIATDDVLPMKSIKATPAAKAKTTLGATALAAKDKVKVPNFNEFRSKFFLIGLAVLLLVGFLVWALVFAPRARIIITARTTDAALNTRVSLASTASTDLKAGMLKLETKSSKKNVSVPFAATGKKDVGEKAMGTVRLSNDSFDAVTVSGTVTAGGFNFVLSSPVTIPKGGCSRPSSCSAGTATGTITAAASGANANGVTGALGNLPDGVTGSLTTATAGGTDKTATVVSQEDVDKVSGDILKSGEADAALGELKKQFGADYIVIDSTFRSDTGAVKPSPAVGAESPDGKGTLAGSVTFSLSAVPKSEASKYLDAYFAQQIDGKSNQKVYSNGLKDASFTNVSATEGGFAANISTNGKIGPKIDETKLREFGRGKRYGEIQQYVEQTNGIDDVDIKFSPFWVQSAPNDVKRITIEFKVNGA